MLVELLYAETPTLDRAAIARRVAERSGSKAEATDMQIMFPDIRVTFSDRDVPLSVALLHAGKAMERQPAWIDKALQQTWSWDRDVARATVDRYVDTLLVTDIAAGPLEPRLRLPAFQAVLASVVELTNPIAMHWIIGERFVEPGQYLDDVNVDPMAFESTVNIRYASMSDHPGEQLMDTVGLRPFLIPDIQMHFTTLEPDWVAGKLLGIARYLFDNGDVIEDGETVPGTSDRERWPCHHEEPMLGPSRVVLDVNPYPYGPQR